MKVVLTPCFYNKKYSFGVFVLICWISAMCVFASSTAQAGLLNSLSKLSKLSKSPDGDLPLISNEKLLLSVDLEGVDINKVVEARPDLDGGWKFRQPDNSFSTKITNAPEVIIIDEFFIPKSLQTFLSLPDKTRVVIRGKQDQFFELQRDSKLGVILKYQGLVAIVENTQQLKHLLWQLQRPLPNAAHLVTQVKYDAQNLAEVFDAQPRSTVVVTGDFKASEFPRVLEHASKRDITLVMTPDADDVERMLKVRPVFNTQGELLTWFGRHKGKVPLAKAEGLQDQSLELQFTHDPSLAQNVLILKVDAPVGVNESIAHDAVHIVASSMMHGHLLDSVIAEQAVVIVHPDQVRTEELEQRIIPWLPSSVHIYVIVSFFLGVMAPLTCWRLWQRIWLIQRPLFQWPSVILRWPMYAALWLLHKLLFLLLLIPLLGAPCFMYVIVTVIYKTLRWLVLRLIVAPYKWLAR